MEDHTEMLNTNYRTDYIGQSGEVSDSLFSKFYARIIKKTREIHISFIVHLGHPIKSKYHFIHVKKQAAQIFETRIHYI